MENTSTSFLRGHELVGTYLTDTVDIKTVAVDKWGVVSSSIIEGVKARIEDKNQLVKNSEGQEVMSNTFLMLPSDIVLSYQTQFRLKTRNGESIEQNERWHAIKSMGKQHGFVLSHWEVYL